MSAARDIRTLVEQAGGSADLTVRQLRDAFGIARLTPAGRQRIDEQLSGMGLRAQPELHQLQLDDRVTLVDVRRRALKTRDETSGGAQAPSSSPGAGRADPWASARAQRAVAASTPNGPRPRRGLSGHGWLGRRGLVAGAIAIVVVLILAAVFGGGDSQNDPAVAQSPAATATSGQGVAAPAAQTRAEALEHLRAARAAVAGDDPGRARALLRQIDEPFTVEAEFGRRVAEVRRLARLDERYLRAEDLADSGAYLAARRTMLSIAPFRKARAKAQAYATFAARSLVSQARGVYVSRPEKALDLLEQAERLAPELAAVDAVRAQANGRIQALAAPKPPPVAPASNCNPAYSGACIPNVPYDLDCPEIAATDFSSVGSDPYGLDGNNDGVACES